jgi:hypothetical protein
MNLFFSYKSWISQISVRFSTIIAEKGEKRTGKEMDCQIITSYILIIYAAYMIPLLYSHVTQHQQKG